MVRPCQRISASMSPEQCVFRRHALDFDGLPLPDLDTTLGAMHRALPDSQASIIVLRGRIGTQ